MHVKTEVALGHRLEGVHDYRASLMVLAKKRPATLRVREEGVNMVVSYTLSYINNTVPYHDLSARAAITQTLRLQTDATAQPARISNHDHESDPSLNSDWPILQYVMASIGASGKA